MTAAALGRPELAPLVDELARRFGEGVPVTVTLRDLDDGHRGALADLLGSPRLPPPTARLGVTTLVRALGLADVVALRDAVEAVRGPIADRRAARAASRAEQEELWSWLVTEAAAVAAAPEGWVARVRAAGARGGIERHRRRLVGALAVLRRLPADGTTLPALANDAIGDPHGLDRGRSVAALVLDALAVSFGTTPPTDAESIRRIWEAAGVAPDALSSTVLVLGLRAPPAHPLAGFLGAAADASEAVSLTLAQLRRWPLESLAPDAAAYVVENPSVLAEAAGRDWTTGPVLVCSSGRPTVAVLVVLRQLAAAGATIHQHADFDPAGVGITAWLADRAGTVPWRMTVADYTAAIHRATEHERPPIILPVPSTPWNPSLADEMTTAGVAVYEEELRADLLDAMIAGEPEPGRRR